MAKEKFLLLSLNDEKAKKTAEIISSDTSRRILDWLAEKESTTETQLHQELGIPLPTVHYHLQRLTEAGLVVVEEFHYSKKGREVNHYKLANKYIIIAPSTVRGIKSRLKGILPAAGVIAGVGLLVEFLSGSLETFRATAPSLMAEKISAPAAQEAAAPLAEEAAGVAMEAGTDQLAQYTAEPIVSTATANPHWGIALIIGGFLALTIYALITSLINRESKR